MKRILLLLLLFSISLISDARIRRAWSDAEMRDQADLVVVGLPVEVEETAERAPLSDIFRIRDGKNSFVMGAGIETKFKVLTVAKGDATLKTFVLHHYREAEGEKSIDSPGFVAFDPKQKKRYIMFLKREDDGRYRAVSGQIDPGVAIREI